VCYLACRLKHDGSIFSSHFTANVITDAFAHFTAIVFAYSLAHSSTLASTYWTTTFETHESTDKSAFC